MRKWLLLLSVVALSASAQTVKVDAGQAGAMAMLATQHPDVENLKVKGLLSADDIRTLRGLKRLKTLNLRGIRNRQLPDSAFRAMASLEGVRLPRKMVRMGVAVFDSCVSLKGIELPEYLKSVPDYAFRDCRSLERVTLFRDVERIGVGAFMNSGVRLVRVGEYLREIDMLAFANCRQLQVFRVPQLLSSIGSRAFAGCTAMRFFHVEASTPPVAAADAFEGDQMCLLYVAHPEFFRDRAPWSVLQLDYNEFNGYELQSSDMYLRLGRSRL